MADEAASNAAPHLPSAPDRVIERLRHLPAEVPGRLVFTTSFGLEDQLLTDLIVKAGLGRAIAFATLDTGRLFPETYDLWAETEQRYGIAIAGFLPDAGAVETLVSEQGINGFRNSPAARQRCCFLRKLAFGPRPRRRRRLGHRAARRPVSGTGGHRISRA